MTNVSFNVSCNALAVQKQCQFLQSLPLIYTHEPYQQNTTKQLVGTTSILNCQSSININRWKAANR